MTWLTNNYKFLLKEVIFLNSDNKAKTTINWFPGHMTKALRMMQKEVENIDVIIYLLDARAPKSSLNPKFLELINNKPVLFVLNKADLSDNLKLEIFKKEFVYDNSLIIELDSTKSGAVKFVEPKLVQLAKNKVEKYAKKGIKYTPKAMVIGIPNCGKSTLINNLSGQTKAITGNKPGVTRGKQTITLKSGIQLIDTPGTLWPSFEKQKTANNLAVVGSIKDDVINIVELACNFINFLKQEYPKSLTERYKLNDLQGDNYEILEKITVKRGLLQKGGIADIEKGASTLLVDFRKGLLGKIFLD